MRQKSEDLRSFPFERFQKNIGVGFEKYFEIILNNPGNLGFRH